MSEADFQLHGIRDPRLAVHATSSLPAWIWSLDGAHILWANTVGARLFGERNAAALAEKTIGPADPRRRQAAQLAARLSPSGATRLERLRGFGAPLGRLLTCSCARLTFADASAGILIAAADPVGRPMPLTERLAHLVDSITMPAMTFTPNGALAGANDRAKNFPGLFNDLTGPGFDDARTGALRNGQSILQMESSRVTVHRVGSGAETALVALIDTVIVPKPMPKPIPVVLAPEEPEPVRDSLIEHPAKAVTPEPALAEAAAQTPAEVSDQTTAPAEVTPVDLFESVFDESSEQQAPLQTVAKIEAAPQNTASDEPEPAAHDDAPRDEPAQHDASAENVTRIYIDDGRRDDVLYSSRPPAAAPSSEPPSGVLPSGTGSVQDNFPRDTVPRTEQNVVDTPQNVVPFPVAEPKSPALTAVESNAFDELARRLAARLDNGTEGETLTDASVAELFTVDDAGQSREPVSEQPALENPPAFLQPEPVLPRANAAQDSQLLDRLPVGVLVYRLDRLIYANKAFLASTGYDNLHALTEAGGLDALIVEAGAGSASSTSETGTPVVIAATSKSGPDKGEPADARLFAITWDNEPAHALVFSGPRTELRIEPAPVLAIAPVAVASDDTTQAEELGTILDNTAEGVLVFDGQGRVLSCNRSAEVLFGRDDNEMATLNLTDLFASDSQRAVQDYMSEVRTAAVTSLLSHDRAMLGRARDGSAIPLSMTLGRTRPDGTRFFAIFRDQSKTKKSEGELTQAKRQVERAVNARADILGRISHEVRMPLSAIIGFADVMIDERFGALGNDRYVEYMKDIRASGQRVMAIIDDLLDLSRIETGRMELSFASQDLNSMVEQCVAVMQPQANRERIIIRTSLAHALPTVKADARALRQIALNLIGNSIHLANAGGQVIVSTATTDFGDIVLRVRDTGPGLNDNEIAAAMAPFRTTGASDQTADGSVVNLSLTKALVEANRAQFHIKTAPHSGTLIEVVFSHASAIA